MKKLLLLIILLFVAPGRSTYSYTVKLTNPNGGETFLVGSETNITWEGISVNDKVGLDYSYDGGANWNHLTNQASGLTYKWENIPLPVSEDCLVRITRVATAEDSVLILSGHTEYVMCTTWSPDGTKVASGGFDKTIRLWDAGTGTEIRELTGHSNNIYSVSWSPDGTKIASGSYDKTIKIWDAENGAELDELVGHSAQVFSVNWSPDGTKIASGSYDKTIKIWDATTGTEIKELSGHTGYVLCTRWSPDGTKIASGSADNTIRIWDRVTGTEIRELTGHSNNVYSISWSPDGTKIVSGSYDKTIKIWDVSTGIEILEINGHSSNVYSVSWSDDGSKIASGGDDKTLKIWDATTGAELREFTGHTDNITTVSWNSDGTRIVSCGWDYSVRIWNAEPIDDQSDISDSVFSIAEARVSLRVLNDSAYAGGYVTLKTILERFDSDKFADMIGSYLMTISVDRTILLPQKELDFDSVRDDRCIIKFSGNVVKGQDYLTQVNCLVGLGQYEFSDLMIEEVIWYDHNGNPVEFETDFTAGTFTLLGICREGGDRLIKPVPQAGIKSISPNPAENKLNIEFIANETEYTEISIYNILGEKVKTLFAENVSEPGDESISADIKELGSGQYLLIFKTAAFLQSTTVIILK